jgi:hypothetical protein
MVIIPDKMKDKWKEEMNKVPDELIKKIAETIHKYY